MITLKRLGGVLRRRSRMWNDYRPNDGKPTPIPERVWILNSDPTVEPSKFYTCIDSELWNDNNPWKN